jgi:putative NADH-flavin reductase
MINPNKILLIGGNGSVGKFLIKHLAPKFNVVALLRSEPKFDVNLYPNLSIYKGDASDQETLNSASQGVNIIVSSYQNYSSGSPTDMFDFVNRLIIAMKKNVTIILVRTSKDCF